MVWVCYFQILFANKGHRADKIISTIELKNIYLMVKYIPQSNDLGKQSNQQT